MRRRPPVLTGAVDTELQCSKWLDVPFSGAWGWVFNQCAQGVVSAVPEPELTMRKGGKVRAGAKSERGCRRNWWSRQAVCEQAQAVSIGHNLPALTRPAPQAARIWTLQPRIVA